MVQAKTVLRLGPVTRWNRHVAPFWVLGTLCGASGRGRSIGPCHRGDHADLPCSWRIVRGIAVGFLGGTRGVLSNSCGHRELSPGEDRPVEAAPANYRCFLNFGEASKMPVGHSAP